ncbi:MAG TPA: sortase, partial [Candidatus Saccharimonadales bacterium]|nr:sortase [Candidatus Saccharimonadales bacterium]
IFLYWEQTKYHYKVQEVFVVKPTAVEVESATDEDVLTLYTCTPLWSGRDRLVIRAVLQGDQQ